MIVCTSICSNYLPKAMILAKSLKETNINVKFFVCLVERDIPKEAIEYEYFDYVCMAKDMYKGDFDKFIFKHSIVEAATSVKGNMFVYLLENFPEENKFVYLDPDIKVYSELKELDELLEYNDIILTPHLTIQEEIKDAVMDNELCALQHGVFNLGFFAIRRSEQGEKIARWWNSRLDMFCYDDIPRGIFTDQKWMDLSPCFFDIYILKHSGYNVAPWNLSKRKISLRSDKLYSNDDELRFFHYSGFDSGANEAMINKYVPNLKDTVYKIRDKYVKEMQELGQKEFEKIEWSYDYYESGEKINKIARIIYRDNEYIKYKIDNPFSYNNDFFLNLLGTNNNVENIDYKKELENIKNSRSWKIIEKVKSNKFVYNILRFIMFREKF